MFISSVNIPPLSPPPGAAAAQTRHATPAVFQMGSTQSFDMSLVGTPFQDIPLHASAAAQAELEQKELDENAVANLLALLASANNASPAGAVSLLMTALGEAKGIIRALAKQKKGGLSADQQDMLRRVQGLQELIISAMQTRVGGRISAEELLGMAPVKAVSLGNHAIDSTVFTGATAQRSDARSLDTQASSPPAKATDSLQPENLQPGEASEPKTDNQNNTKGQPALSRVSAEVMSLMTQAATILQHASENPATGNIMRAMRILDRAEAMSALCEAASGLDPQSANQNASSQPQIQTLRHQGIALMENPATQKQGPMTQGENSTMG